MKTRRAFSSEDRQPDPDAPLDNSHTAVRRQRIHRNLIGVCCTVGIRQRGLLAAQFEDVVG